MEEGKKQKQDKKAWYKNSNGPERKLLPFFSELVYNCFGGSPRATGEIQGTEDFCSNKRPFNNALRKSKKSQRTRTFLTPLTRAYFLELALRRNCVSEAVKNIKKSTTGWYIADSACDFKKPETCPNTVREPMGLCKCTESISRRTPFRKICANCPVKIIADFLEDIEKKCNDEFKSADKIGNNYASSEDEKTAEKIYTDVKKFENNFNPETITLTEICDLFNSCIPCYHIKDTARYELAYIKWYTARLCTWPYFKSKLVQINKYNEHTVYSLLRSASNICKALLLEK